MSSHHPPTQVVKVHFLHGSYGIRLDGWLRSTANADEPDPAKPGKFIDKAGDFVQSSRPLIQHPVVMAGFQSPPAIPTDVTKLLPSQVVNSGYYPYGFVGIINYYTNKTVDGQVRVSIGGNSNGQARLVQGKYDFYNPDGKLTLIDQSNKETFTYYFVVLADGDIFFMDISSQDFGRVGRSITGSGVQKPL